MIVTPKEDPLNKLDLIDTIQRLGVSYHFENEIETVLMKFSITFIIVLTTRKTMMVTFILLLFVFGCLDNRVIMFHVFEQKRGHVASAVECYMKQYEATEEEVVKDLWKHVADAWKDINEECLYPISVPMLLLMRILNLARVIDVIYKDDDGYTHSGVVLKDFIASLLIDPVPE